MSRIVKNYEVHHVLGEGGMGTVYYAVETQLRREVALKCLRPDVASNPGVMERFRNEAQAQAQLNHPNVAHLYEYFQVGSEHYMAMEFVSGSTLAKILRVKVRLPFEEAVAFALQALRGLEHAHKHGIIHRDIKPTNLLLNRESQIKVTDFGIARLSGSTHPTREGVIIGTYEYISPEAAQGLPTTALSDLYSMGVVLFEMIAGRLPFNSQSDFELLRMHAQAPRPSLRAAVKDVPSAIDEIVQRAMDRNPGRRFRSAEEMALALQKCLEPARRASPALFKRLLALVGETERGMAPAAGPPVLERRRTDISQTCHKVEDLLEQHLWTEAGAVLDTGLRTHPDDPDLIDLRNRLQRQRQQHEQAVGQQAQLVSDLLLRGLPEEAMKLVDNALAIYPRATALLDLKRECRRRTEIANTTAGELVQVENRVDELIAAGQFKEGEDYVLELIGHYPNQSELDRLLTRVLQARKDAEKRAAISQYLAEAGAAAGMGQWDAALAILDAALRRFAGDSTLDQAKRDLQDRWLAEQRRQAVQTIVAQARSFEQSGALEAAREKLNEGVVRFSTEPLLQEELARVDAALEALRRKGRIDSAVAAASALEAARRWAEALDLLDRTTAADGPDPGIQELRAVIAAEFRAHQAVLNRTVAECRLLIDEKRWEEAVLKLSPAARQMTNEPVLAGLLHEAQRGLAAKRQAETIARLMSEAENKVRQNDLQAAIELLLDAIAQYPEDAALGAAISRTVSLRDERIAQQKISTALLRAAEFRGADDFEKAAETLRQALVEVSDSTELRTALEDCERQRLEHRRRLMLQDTSAFVETNLAAGNYPAALDRLARELAAWPADRELLSLDARARGEQRADAVRNALVAVLASASVLEGRQGWAEAADTYEQALSEFPEMEAEVRPRIEAARTRELEERRRERLRTLERDLAQFIQSESLAEASALLQSARSEFPDEPCLQELQDRLEREQRRVARIAAIASVQSRTTNLLAERSFEEANRVVLESQAELGPDPALLDLRAAIRDAEEEHRVATERLLAEIQSECDRANWEAAIVSAAACSQRFPSEPRFKLLLDRAVGNRDQEKRSQETARRVSQIRVLVAENALEDAAVLLRNALRDDPGEPSLAEIQRTLGEARRVQALLEDFARDGKEVAKLCRAREWEAARRVLAPYSEISTTAESAGRLLRGLEAQEVEYRQRIEAIETQGRDLLLANRYDESAKLLSNAIREYPEVRPFGLLLGEAREKLFVEKRNRLSDEVRALLEQNRLQQALAVADRGLLELPGDISLKDLRTAVLAAIGESALAAVVAEVKALIESDDASHAELVLLEGLRKFPESGELNELRPIVDAARSAEWEKKSSEAARKRALAGIQQLLNEHKLPAAAAAVRLFQSEYGEGAESFQAAIDQAVRAQQERQASYTRGRAEFDSLLRQGRYDEAIAQLEQLLAAFPEDPALQHDLESAKSAKSLHDRRVLDPAGVRQRPDPPPRKDTPDRRVLIQVAGILAQARVIQTRILESIGPRRWLVGAAGSLVLAAVIYGVWSPSGVKPLRLDIQPAELEFRYRQGDPPPYAQSVRLLGASSRTAWNVNASDRWLRAYPDAASGNNSISVQVDTAGLAPSDYLGSLLVSSGDRSALSKTVQVRLHVLPALTAQRSSDLPSGAAAGERGRKPLPDQTARKDAAQPVAEVNGTNAQGSVGETRPPGDEARSGEPGEDCHKVGLQGELSWMGVLQPGQTVTIGRENKVLSGPVATVKGSPLPGCEVTVVPRNSGINVTEQPAQANRFGLVTIRNTSSRPIMHPRLGWTVK